jgi:YHS domain-containing protein
MRSKQPSIAKATFVIVIAFVGAAMAGGPRVEDVDRSKVCMLEDQLQPRAGLEEKYEGKTYFLCCSMCEEKFRSNPERYSKARDPVSGASVDKATAPVVGYKDRAYFFESDNSRATFAQDPERYVQRLKE